MFTGNTKWLSEFQDEVGFGVMRDCEFSFAAKIPSDVDKRVVPCGTPEHVALAAQEEGVVGVITTEACQADVPKHLGLAISEVPVDTCNKLHETLVLIEGFQWEDFETMVHPEAIVHPTATIAEKNVVIGKGTTIGPNSVVFERSIIGEDSHIGESVVVGLDALEITSLGGKRRVLKQAGGVKIGNNVTILAKTTVVRATFGGFTELEDEAIVDVLVHIAHDCKIKKRATLVACSEISGRCVIGEDAYIGPNACLRNGITVGNNSKVTMGAVVTRDVPKDTMVSGNFAVEHSKWLNFVKEL
ncbi:MAG: DapH/DapD/GlmU-related protein [Pseudomonadota bacterium]